MNKDQQIEAIENILSSDINLSPMMKQALKSIVETLKRIDAERTQKTKAFIFAGNKNQYYYFIKENHLNEREYPQLNENNWLGVKGVDLIRIGTFFENHKLLDMLPDIESRLRGK